MKLTENEKRDILKYLDKNKPLPDKYRFLLFDDDREVELLWNGKTNEVTNLVLPFQTIEHIDEPRAEEKIEMQRTLFDTSGRQLQGWTNKLIWGDNKLILSSLKNGPLRKEIEAQGGLKLIYIDPPFDVGADFSMNIKIGDEEFTKKPSVIEEIAYRDTWGKGADSFIAMIYERLKLMHDLLANDGSIYVHCDWRVNSYMRLVLDEVFGKDNFVSEIIWKKLATPKAQTSGYGNIHDTLFFYKNGKNHIFNEIKIEHSDDYLNSMYRHIDDDGRKYRLSDFTQKGQGEAKKFANKILEPPRGKHWIWSQDKIDEGMKKGLIVFSKNGIPSVKRYLDEVGGHRLSDLWTQIKPMSSQAKERTDYPTQKPNNLLDVVIKSSSNEGDLVADFFCGSGTTLAVAEKLGRKWIGSDLGRFSIHTTRKRMIGIQRELKKEGKNFRAFEILNLGKYERQYYVGENPDFKDEKLRKRTLKKQNEFLKLILSAYKAEPVEQMPPFHGKKRDRMVIVGPVDLPVTHSAVDEAIKFSKRLNITKVDILGFDYEMGIDFSKAKSQGIDMQFKIIPREVFDKKAVEKGQVKFYDVAYIEIKPITKGRANKKTVAIELIDFSVFYNQDNTGEVEEKLKSGGSKVVIEDGRVIKIFKDKKTDGFDKLTTGIIEREILTKKWTDWVDYWAVDFDMESKKEIVREINPDTGKEEEKWTGDYIFENEWQSFRTKKDRKLELVSAVKEVPKGRRKIGIKVVDIFGNDTTKVVEINI